LSPVGSGGPARTLPPASAGVLADGVQIMLQAGILPPVAASSTSYTPASCHRPPPDGSPFTLPFRSNFFRGHWTVQRQIPSRFQDFSVRAPDPAPAPPSVDDDLKRIIAHRFQVNNNFCPFFGRHTTPGGLSTRFTGAQGCGLKDAVPIRIDNTTSEWNSSAFSRIGLNRRRPRIRVDRALSCLRLPFSGSGRPIPRALGAEVLVAAPVAPRRRLLVRGAAACPTEVSRASLAVRSSPSRCP